jgi:hypothetical protein
MENRSDRRAIPTPTVRRECTWDEGGETTVARRPARSLRTTRCAVQERIATLRANRNRTHDDPLTK